MKHKFLLSAICMLMALFGTATAQTITIGTGTSSTTTHPYGINYKYSTTQSIYTAAEIGGACTITSIAYNVASTGKLSTTSVQIYMGHRSSSSFSSSSDYENVSNMTLVYSGSPTLASSTGWETLTLQTPFVYYGTSNLVVVVAKQAANYTSALYYYTSTSTTQCLYRQSINYSGYGTATNASYSYSTSYCRANVRFGVKGFTQNGIIYGIVGDNVAVCGTTQSTGSLTIPATVTNDGKTYNVSAIVGGAFQGCTGLTSISIPSSVTSIGSDAFRYCSGLTSITIPSSVTSIGSDAFTGCTGIKDVKIENGTSTLSLGYKSNSSNSNYNYGLFKDCPIESLHLGRNLSYNTHSYNSSYPGYGAPFEYQSKLKDMTISSSVTSIGSYAFFECSGLTSITIPSSVTSIGSYACYNCSGLTSITIPSSVTSIGDYAFYGCRPKSLIIGAGVTSIGSYAFSSPVKTIWLTNTPPSGYTYASGNVNYVSNANFSSLSNTKQYAYLSSYFDVNGVRYVPVNPSARTCDAIDCTYAPADSIYSIGKTVSYRNIAMTVSHINQYLAYQNSKVRKLTVTADAPIDQYAFYGCDSLREVNLSNSGNIGSSAFYGCTSLQNAVISITGSIGSSAFCECTGLQTATIGNTGSIGSSAFYGCTKLNNCSVGDKVTTIEGSAFASCSTLPTISLGKNIASIGNYVFQNCSKLQEIAIPDATTSIGSYCFSGCTSLQKASTGDGATAIPDYAFSGCTKLNAITIGDSVKTINQYAFRNCSALADIAIPSHVTTINNYAFYGCTKLADVVIADRKEALKLGNNGSSPLFSDCPLDSLYIGGKITYNTSSSYGYSPFYRNTNLRTVVITNEETEIYPNEFYGCTGLKNVKIGDGVQKIDDYAFSGCSSLEQFTFGTGLQSIGTEGFSDCTALVTLATKAATPPTCGTQALDDINKWNCTLYVPQANTAAYQAADQWKDFFFISTIEGTALGGNEEFAGMHRIISDGVTFQNTLTRDYDTVTYVRNFTSHDWEAIYLPFSMSYADWKDNFEVARINAFYQYDDDEDGDIDRSVLQAIKVKNSELKANVPYLIRATVPGEKSFNLLNKTVHTSKANSLDCSTVDTKFTFVGTFSSVLGSALSSKTCYAMEEGALKKVTATTTIPACRWYIEVEGRTTESPINAPAMRVLVSEDEESVETDIEAIENLTDEDTPAYMLDGRRAAKTMPGMVVKNGKKFIRK